MDNNISTSGNTPLEYDLSSIVIATNMVKLRGREWIRGGKPKEIRQADKRSEQELSRLPQTGHTNQYNVLFLLHKMSSEEHVP
jgi:hypothetical protein